VWFAKGVWHAGHDRVSFKQGMGNQVKQVTPIKALLEVGKGGDVEGIPALQSAN